MPAAAATAAAATATIVVNLGAFGELDPNCAVDGVEDQGGAGGLGVMQQAVLGHSLEGSCQGGLHPLPCPLHLQEEEEEEDEEQEKENSKEDEE